MHDLQGTEDLLYECRSALDLLGLMALGLFVMTREMHGGHLAKRNCGIQQC